MTQPIMAKNPDCQIGANELIVKLVGQRFDKDLKEKNELNDCVKIIKRLGLSEANHNLKLFITLIYVTALCDFRPYRNIYEFCKNWMSLKRLLCGNKVIECLNRKTSDAVQSIYETLMAADNYNILKARPVEIFGTKRFMPISMPMLLNARLV
uniref:Uncharacterized protein n=1 Tax=Glossina pallidipes TaxID=7398 RepID=A0A1A9ZS97_GLOPL